MSSRPASAKVLKSVTPGQQTIKIVHDKLIELMGGSSAELDLSASQPSSCSADCSGSGKPPLAQSWPCSCKNTANALCSAACDVYRPAAIDQLEVLGKS